MGSIISDRTARILAQALAFAAVATMAGACGDDGDGPASAASGPRPPVYGRSAEAAEATRQIDVKLSDDLRIDPAEISVKKGETITFRVTNMGKTPHELAIGGENAQQFHGAQMLVDPKLVPGMESMSMQGHEMMMKGMGMDVPSQKEVAALDERAEAFAAVSVMPGETKDLTWAFTGEAPLLGCHIPGHYQGGMRGKVTYTQ